MSSEDDPFIEIFIPYVSQPHFLERAIGSIQNQTVHKWRLTIVDNSDHPVVISQLVTKLNDPRVVHAEIPESQSMVDNWNNCLRQCEGEYAIICHSDDEWERKTLEMITHLISSKPDGDVYFTGGKTIDESGKSRFNLIEWYKSFLLRNQHQSFTLSGEDGLRLLARGNFVFCSTTCYRMKEGSFKYFDHQWRFAPDYKLLLDFLLSGGTLVGSKEKLCLYRRHSQQATIYLEKSSTRFEEELKLYDWLAGKSDSLNLKKVKVIAQWHLSLRLHLIFAAAKLLVKIKPLLAFRYLRLAIK